MNTLRVGVIFGGRSSEKEVSLNSGRHVFNILDRSRFAPVAIFMDSRGRLWNIPLPLVVQNTTADVEARLGEAERLPYEILKERIDVAFLTTFGKYGEDGCLQGLLELLKIPYTASGVLGAALGTDKAMQRVLMKQNPSINVPPYVVIPRSFGLAQDDNKKARDDRMGTARDDKLNYQLPITNYPVVVKPTREGSTIGVTVVKCAEDLEHALKTAFEYDATALVEPYLEGLEFSCVVLDGDLPEALPPTETLHSDEIFSYHDKYMPGASKKITPARVSPEQLMSIQSMCRETFTTLGLSGYARIDGFVLNKSINLDAFRGPSTPPDSRRGPLGDYRVIAQRDAYPAETVLITDPNVFSGMAPSSWTFHQAATVGMTPTQLLSKIIDNSLRRTSLASLAS